MIKIAIDVLAAIPLEAKEWTEDRAVVDEKTQEITGTTPVQVQSNRVYIVERNGERQFVQSRKALPCIAVPEDGDTTIVGSYWKVNPDNDGEVRDGPRDITRSMWDAWVAAGAITDVKDTGDIQPMELPR